MSHSHLTMRDKRPVVTVIMPTYNAARTIRRAIDSVVAQSYADWHLICVDDASTDQTVEIVRSYTEGMSARIEVLESEANDGPARARNRGLAKATGEWVAVLDADDAWQARRLERLLRLARHENADGVCDNLTGFDDHRERQTENLFGTLPRVLDITTTVAAEYQGRYNLGYLKPIMRREFLAAHAITYDEVLRTGEDLLFLLSCLGEGGRIVCDDTPGYIYTTPIGHGSGKLSRSTTTAPRDMDLGAGLQRFIGHYGSTLALKDKEAVQQRIAYLAAIAPLANFRHARLNRRWGTALQLFIASAQIRRQVLSAALLKRRRFPGTRA